MAGEVLKGFLGLVFVRQIILCYGFNLDARFSAIKKGDSSAYFGYSVAVHQVLDDTTGRVIENLLLVGAPKADVPEINVQMGGAIFKCPSDTTFENDCTRLIDAPFNIPPKIDEDMKNQWLGVVLQSQGAGKNILTCGHRYKKSKNGIGICYTLKQNLEFHASWRPCYGRPDSHDHEQFGLCQSGVSSMLTVNDGILIGAPGSTYWRGVVFQSNISRHLGADKAWYKSPIPFEEGSDITLKPPVDKYAYLGYSVTSGIFDKTKERYYISGAPRSQQTGEVIFFTKSSDGSLRYVDNQKFKGSKDFSAFGYSLLSIDLNNDQYDDLIVGAPFYHDKHKNVGGAIYIYLGGGNMIINLQKPIEILSRSMNDNECVKLGCKHARFGLSLSKLGDINIDGYQDFAVGAPYEGNGAVYIYHGNKNAKFDNAVQRLTAEDVNTNGLKSFGFSLSGGIDLDNNGYPDLLVGSFEVGQVALIRTRPIINLMKRVTILPEMIDLEKDPYCSFDAELKHCFQIEICLQFTAEPAQSFQNRPKINYRIEAEKNRGILINRLELKKSTDDASRIINRSIILRRQGVDGSPSKEVCKKEIAYLKDSFADKLNPLQLTIEYSLDEVEYVKPNPGDPQLDIQNYPILATDAIDKDSESVTMTALVEFVKECGDDNVCNSNLQMTASLGLPKDSDGKYVLSTGEKSFIDLNIEIMNIGEASYLTQVFITKPESLQYRRLETLNGTAAMSNVKCQPDDDNKTMINCEGIGNPLPQNQKVVFIVKLDAHDLLPSQQILEMVVMVNTSSTEVTKESDIIKIPFRVINRADVGVSGIAQPDDPLIYSGVVRGESAISNEDQIGPAINHTFVVTNYGPGTVSKSVLYIDWPYEVENGNLKGKHLLYLMQAPQVMSGNAECNYNPEIVNPAGIKENPRYIIRPSNRGTPTAVIPGGVISDAAVKEAPPETIVENPSESDPGYKFPERNRRSADRVKRSDKDVILGCKQDTAKCHTITCKIGELRSTDYVTIIVRARLWESTFLQDYRKVREVKIRSRGELVIDPVLNVEQTDLTNDITYAETIAIPDVKVAEPKGIDWWIILVAVLAGVLLLVILILILWKLGFFKRKKPEDMQTYEVKFEKKKESVEEYYD